MTLGLHCGRAYDADYTRTEMVRKAEEEKDIVGESQPDVRSICYPTQGKGGLMVEKRAIAIEA